MQETERKSTSERLSELLKQLSKDQLRFVVAFQDYPNKKDAAEAIGLKPNTVYKWPAIVDEAAVLMALEAMDSALAIRRRNLIKAMMVKVGGLDSNDERIRQGVATEIIEGELGKAGQKLDITSKGEPIGAVDNDGFNRAISTLADAVRESVFGQNAETRSEVDTAE